MKHIHPSGGDIALATKVIIDLSLLCLRSGRLPPVPIALDSITCFLENSSTYQPPRYLPPTTLGPLYKALLHPIRQFPPLPRLLILTDALHICLKIISDIAKISDEK